MSDPCFVPRPRSVTRTDGTLAAADVDALRRSLTESLSEGLADEAYRLVVTPEGATLTAGTETGLLLGRTTWRQLLDGAERDEAGGAVVPCLSIEDAPTYSWRGLMVDCSRHVTPVAELERLVDALALHRMNRLHLHLTDDQGWRVEIAGWPRLTQVGAWRNRTLVGHNDTIEGPEAGAPGAPTPVWTEEPHGGHYTQAELRALVRYAAERGVVLVPEIDLPGHMQAAIAAYPELGNLGTQVGVREHWGVSEHVLAPTEAAFAFVRDVLTQVLDIFPGPWVHIGGDECPTAEWEHSEQAQRYLAEHGLATERDIQHAFLAAAHEVIAAAGRTMIGWDEILEAGSPPDTVVMLWRIGTDVALAQRHGRRCVYANAATLYLDHYQADPADEPLAFGGRSTLADVYGLRELTSARSTAQQVRMRRSSTRTPNCTASTGTRSSTPWNIPAKSRSAGRRSGANPYPVIPRSESALLSVPPESMYGSTRAPGSSDSSAATIASTSEPENGTSSPMSCDTGSIRIPGPASSRSVAIVSSLRPGR